MWTISKRFEFSASHQLSGLPVWHQCGRMHGHNYIVEIVLKGTLNDVGFVRDYGDLSSVKEWIDATLDHRHLNDVLDLNPTAELMARFIYRKFKPLFVELSEVRVSETAKTWASYSE